MTVHLLLLLLGFFKLGRRPVRCDGLEIGRRFDMRPLLLPWPHCPHIQIGGETGSGKSGVCNAIIGELAADAYTAICGIDLKLVELSPWRDRLTVLATTPGEADQLLLALRRLIKDRAEFLQARGLRIWDSRYGPWVVVVVDELAELQAIDADALADAIESGDGGQKALRAGRNSQNIRVAMLGSLARLARFCGVTLVGATQYPSVEVVDQQIRTQLTIKIMLRVASGEQVRVCLGEGYGMSISPKSIGVSERGGLWIVGLPDNAEPVRARAHWISDADVAARVAATAHLTPSYNTVFAPGADPIEEAY